MIRGEQFYDFDKNDFTEEEIQYIEARSHELVDDDPNFVTDVTAIDYDDARYVTISTQFPGVDTFAEAGRIRDEKAHDFEDSIELVSLRERVSRALGGVSLYGKPEESMVARAEKLEGIICASKSLFKLKYDKFTSDEVDYIWSCVQARVDSLAPYTRFEVLQRDNYTAFVIAIESDLSTITDNMDSLRQTLVQSVNDDDLREKFEDSMGAISTHSDHFHKDELGYGVGNFDEYIESRKKSN